MKKMMVALLTGAMLIMATSVMATPFSGSLWSSNASAQDPAAGPAGTFLGSFTVDKINFNTLTYGSTYDTWLQGSLTNANGLTWLTAIPSGFITSTTTGTFMQLTGSGYFNANTAITHDDGFYLTLGSTTYDYSTPTYTRTDTLNNAAGVYNFTLNYGAWNGFPETLIVDIAPVPEPATMLLLGLGLMGVAGIRRFKK